MEAARVVAMMSLIFSLILCRSSEMFRRHKKRLFGPGCVRKCSAVWSCLVSRGNVQIFGSPSRQTQNFLRRREPDQKVRDHSPNGSFLSITLKSIAYRGTG